VPAGEEWEVKNRFTRVTIGLIKYCPITGGMYSKAVGWCYHPIATYWHQEIVLSQTNLQDILIFIKKLKPVDVYK
jgi:hypothetical protein